MSRDITELEAILRPFEVLPFVRRTSGDRAAGAIKESDAHAALQSELALHGVRRVTPERAEELLLDFGVEGNQARSILVELWQHAYKKLLFRDDKVDRGEHDYLDALQQALGLSRAEIKRARAEIPEI